jgi:hypothetical protein
MRGILGVLLLMKHSPNSWGEFLMTGDMHYTCGAESCTLKWYVKALLWLPGLIYRVIYPSRFKALTAR